MFIERCALCPNGYRKVDKGTSGCTEKCSHPFNFFLLYTNGSKGRGGLNFIFGRYVQREAPKWSKELIFCKSKAKEVKIFNILRGYKLKFEPNLGCRAENSSDFWQISLLRVKIWYFCSKGCLENWITLQLGIERMPDIPIPPFQTSTPQE